MAKSDRDSNQDGRQQAKDSEPELELVPALGRKKSTLERQGDLWTDRLDGRP